LQKGRTTLLKGEIEINFSFGKACPPRFVEERVEVDFKISLSPLSL